MIRTSTQTDNNPCLEVPSPWNHVDVNDVDVNRWVDFYRQVRRLKDYLDGIIAEAAISPKVGTLALRAWQTLADETGNTLAVPDACPDAKGNLLFTWDSGPHHLELEVTSDPVCEFFYRSRSTGSLWEADYEISGEISSEILRKLRLFCC